MCVIQQGKINALFWVKFSWISEWSAHFRSGYETTFHLRSTPTGFQPNILRSNRSIFLSMFDASFVTSAPHHSWLSGVRITNKRHALAKTHEAHVDCYTCSRERKVVLCPDRALLHSKYRAASVDSSTHTQTHTHTRSQSDEIFSKPMWVRGHTSTGNSRCLCCAWIFVW